MGLKLFMHSVRLLFDNLRTALRITGLVYLLCILLPSFLFVRGEQPPTPEQMLLQSAAAVVSLAGGMWIAVAWHRYILLGEMPNGLLPEFNGRRVLSYFGWSILLGLILLPVIIATALVGVGLGSIGGPAAIIVAGLVSVFAVTAVLYRMAPILPALAVDRRLRLGEAWQATSGATGDILVLTLLTAIMVTFIDVPALAFTGPTAFLGLAWQAVTGWFILLVGVGIMTTLYGHYVEGRPIS